MIIRGWIKRHINYTTGSSVTGKLMKHPFEYTTNSLIFPLLVTAKCSVSRNSKKKQQHCDMRYDSNTPHTLE